MHSDRGSKYVSTSYQQQLMKDGFIFSMSRKGNCWDNVVAEIFFHTFKIRNCSS
ncbi:MAG: DDE-type integrase/transposase/recombinase [Pseudomonadales bacterium]|nr:DDE-type integrase/transposase/recombinase [Pseudomonadales bacterium]